MITRIISLVFSVGLFLSIEGATRASIIVDHQPHPYGGPSSDTAFLSVSGQPYWQRLADDFTLSAPEQVTNVNFWGFYDADDPPTQETMRVRFYEERTSDGLPGDLLMEESFQNPGRMWTGRQIAVGIAPREYFFQVELASPVALDAGTLYWLEVVQIGDVATKFRWETSVTDNTGLAFINPQVVDWRLALSQGDTAFQLISPEPTSSALLAFGLSFVARRRRSGK